MAYIISQNENTPTNFTLPGAGSNVIDVYPETFVEAIVLNPLNADAVNIGSTDGGTEYEAARPLNAGQNNTILIQLKYGVFEQIFITGLTGKTEGTIYKR